MIATLQKVLCAQLNDIHGHVIKTKPTEYFGRFGECELCRSNFSKITDSATQWPKTLDVVCMYYTDIYCKSQFTGVLLIYMCRCLPSPPVPTLLSSDAAELITGVQQLMKSSVLTDDQVCSLSSHINDKCAFASHGTYVVK